MLSAKANELDEAIRSQDELILRAVRDNVPARFIRAAVEVRNELVRELAAEWQAAS